MKSLQILNNRYICEKQELEYRLECEINKQYPDINEVDQILTDLTALVSKEDYLNNMLIQISHARNTNNNNNDPE
jgi:putative IMPACT (imprinted ancient) family translation regulator